MTVGFAGARRAIGPLMRAATGALGALLTVIGWGVGDLRTFGEEPARVATLVIIAVGLPFVAGAVRYRAKVVTEVRSQIIVAGFNIFGVVVLLAGSPRLDAVLDPSSAWRVPLAVRWAGVAGFGAGLLVYAWSIRTLGRFFTMRVALIAGHELVTAGPYGRVRHPAYTGLLLWMAALPIAFGTWFGLAVLVIAVPLVIRRMTQEEHILATHFGPTYDAYQRRTHRLIPGVY